jgi:hypothetical protein
MSRTLLIDSIVRQTTVLIASLATAAGHGPSLAHLADHVLGNLVGELRGVVARSGSTKASDSTMKY